MQPNSNERNDELKQFLFGSFYSPYPGIPGNEEQNRNGASIYSNNRGSIYGSNTHNKFWRSPVGQFGLSNESPLA